MANMSAPVPPLSANDTSSSTLNVSATLPPWSVSNAENPSVVELSLYVGVPSKAHVDVSSRPVSVSVPTPPVSVVIPLISASRLTVSSPA